ncbi:MAG: DUF2178 domain-containing protein [Candidatus Methanoperedens sp.]|nr:DUF2178 domain-containing protein [Candidatus Methanoperedens sp.]
MKFRKDKVFLVSLGTIIVGLATVAVGISTMLQNISEGNPVYYRSAVFAILFGISISMTAFFRMSMPGTGVVGDERTKKAVEKAGFWSYLILLGCLLILGLVNSFWEAIMDFRLMPFVLASIGIFSCGILTYYFDKKGE